MAASRFENRLRLIAALAALKGALEIDGAENSARLIDDKLHAEIRQFLDNYEVDDAPHSVRS